MLIVDAQVHIWSSGKPTNANHRQVAAFTKDDLLKEMDEAGVDAAVIHPPASWDPNSNELAVEAARSIRTAWPSSATSRSTSPRAAGSSTAGRSGRGCSGCASSSCSRT